MDLFFKEYGDGQPLIIAHGLLGASGNWHTLSRNTFADHFRVLALDLRNHGRSPHSDRFDIPVMAEDIVRCLDNLGIEQAHLLGHSMGGKVAMHMALEYSSRVDRLIVVDIAPRAYPPAHEHIFEGLRALDLAAFESRSQIDRALAAYVDELPIRQFLLKNLSSDGTGTYSWKMNLEGIYANYARINEAIQSDRTFPRPALFIEGERSTYITEDDRLDIRALFPRSEVVTVPGAGHWVHAEAPRHFSERVMGFLKPGTY